MRRVLFHCFIVLSPAPAIARCGSMSVSRRVAQWLEGGVRIRSRVRLPKQQYGSHCRLLPLFRLVVASGVVLSHLFQPTGLAQPIQQPTGMPTVDATQTLKARIEQFKNEKVFWKQIEIAKAIAGTHDASVLPPLADWLAHRDRHIRGNVAFIFASYGDPRGLETIADILADRSERPEGQGIANAPRDAATGSSGKLPQTVLCGALAGRFERSARNCPARTAARRS